MDVLNVDKLRDQNKIIEFKLEFNEHGQLFFVNKEKKISVYIKKCFPWSNKDSFFSIRNQSDEEVLLIEDINALDEHSRDAIISSLLASGFCFIINDIITIKEDYELRVWEVETNQGMRQFQTELMAWPRELSSGGLLIQDLAGDIYYIPKVSELKPSGKKLLWAFID
ncbi:MAG: DUF1854 domain-containing protein [Bdellovibrionales bacterium]|nr:DUF1854 domain-containing protein [Bdellovibrionales bacterium]